MSGEGCSRSCSDSLLVSSPSVGADVDACKASCTSARIRYELAYTEVEGASTLRQAYRPALHGTATNCMFALM